MDSNKRNLSSGGNEGETDEPLIQANRASSIPPKDKYLGAFFILFLHGCAVLAPWNMYITICQDYFISYKIENAFMNQTEKDEWKLFFCHRMTVANQGPNMIFTLINCFIHFGEHTLGYRIIASLLIVVASFVVTVLLAVIDTTEIPYVFIYVSLIAVVFMMSAVGIYQNCVFGLAGPLPMLYANAIILGNNFVGVLIVVFSIVLQISSPDMKMAAIYYFMAGIFLLLAAFDTYFALPLLKFYRYYLRLKEQHQSNNEAPTLAETLKTFGTLFRKLWFHYWDVFGTFFVTLFVFPNVAMWIKPAEDEGFFVPDNLYSSILCFLTFNVCAFLGNLIPNVIDKPGPKYLWIFTTGRLLFIPLFCLFNYIPPVEVGERRLSFTIKSSWLYWLSMILMALSHGHCSSLAMMYAPKQAEPRLAGKAAMLAGVFLVFGVNIGIISSGVVNYVLFESLN